MQEPSKRSPLPFVRTRVRVGVGMGVSVSMGVGVGGFMPNKAAPRNAKYCQLSTWRARAISSWNIRNAERGRRWYLPKRRRLQGRLPSLRCCALEAMAAGLGGLLQCLLTAEQSRWVREGIAVRSQGSLGVKWRHRRRRSAAASAGSALQAAQS